jgi:hypothetical protein
MQELLLILGAAALFCVLAFGAAWVAAGWMTGAGRWRWTSRRRRRK